MLTEKADCENPVQILSIAFPVQTWTLRTVPIQQFVYVIHLLFIL